MTDTKRYTHGHADIVLRAHRSRTAKNSAAYLLPELRPGMDLLDIGSGPGTITADLAELVAPGRVTALETVPEIAELAGAEAKSRGLSNVDVTVGDVQRLELPSNCYDVVHAHQVLQHIGDPVAAMCEMMRVCRPGGLVAVRDADFAGFVWYPEIPQLDRWRDLLVAAARANGGELEAGRRLLAWAHAAGARTLTASSSTWCYCDPESRAEWGGMWAERMTTSAIAHQLVETGLSTPEELQQISAAWRAWAAHPDGWMSLLHGEVIIRV
jgi:SAM-dependent methyltransferase